MFSRAVFQLSLHLVYQVIFLVHPSLCIHILPGTRKKIHAGSIPYDRSSAKPARAHLFLLRPTPVATPDRAPADDPSGWIAGEYVPTTTHLLLYDEIQPATSEHICLMEYLHLRESSLLRESPVH